MVNLLLSVCLLPHGTQKREGHPIRCGTSAPVCADTVWGRISMTKERISWYSGGGDGGGSGVRACVRVCVCTLSSTRCFSLPLTVKPGCKRGEVGEAPNTKLRTTSQCAHRMNTGLRVSHALRVQGHQKVFEPLLSPPILLPHLH